MTVVDSDTIDIKMRDMLSQTTEDGEDELDRGQWSSKADYLVTAISFTIGLGNLWRFPYKCYSNGGGAFLIPYLLATVFLGLPLYLLENSHGQFLSRGPIGVWEIAPLLRGVGFAMVTANYLCCVYYNIIVGWILYYVYLSLAALFTGSEVPWNRCPELDVNCSDPAQLFWKDEILHVSGDVGQVGRIQWDLLGFDLLSCTIITAFVIKGLKVSGKVTYVTAVFPYVVLTGLFIRGVTLEGAADGIKYFFEPDWSKLLEAEVWTQAATQVFYSMGLAFGTLLTMASYNDFHNNMYVDAVTITLINCGTSVFGGVVVFAVIGFLAHTTGASVAEVIDDGPGLAFVAYPAALAQVPFAAFFSLLFFLMLLSLGVGSLIPMQETIISAVLDLNPVLNRSIIALITTVFMFVPGILMVTNGGIYWFTLFDNYSCSYSLFIFVLIEVVVIAWVYGIKKYGLHFQVMTGVYPNCYWVFSWQFIVPIITFAIIVANLVFYSESVYAGTKFPLWFDSIGWVLAFVSIVWIPGYALYAIVYFSVHGESVKELVQPTEFYRPDRQADFRDFQRLLGETDSLTNNFPTGYF